MKKLIIVSDWAGDFLTRAEFTSATEGFLKDSSLSKTTFISSTPSTIHTAYLLQQVIETEERLGRPQETVIFQNTDPRLQATKSTVEAQGAEFVILKLMTGIIVCGPNAGYDFSLIKDKIERFYIYRGFDKGSQFRSRDLYSRVCAHLMDELDAELELEELSKDAIPRLEGFYIGHIDNYGNIKTTITKEDFKGKFEFSNGVEITINNVTKKARYVSNLFGGDVGELVIYPGSSGKKDNPYLEVSIWRHFTEENATTGLHEFNHPKPGAQVKF